MKPKEPIAWRRRAELAKKSPCETAWREESAEIEALLSIGWDEVDRLSAWLVKWRVESNGAAVGVPAARGEHG